jgi:lon-related putative ATP-dependent protease
MPLDLKVVLFGDRVIYYLLAAIDPELEDLFKVIADFETRMERSADSAGHYARLIAALAHQDLLRPFDRGAMARVIEQASRLAGDAQKLSIHLRAIGDLLREASDVARRAGHESVTAADVDAAIASQRHRADRLQRNLLEAIRRRTLLIDTRGEAVGQINGLSVVELGHQAFGHPTRITASARLGAGEIIDIEREVELGGPVHSKGMMILASLIGARYAQHSPLALSARLVFEQSYGGVEGDSASLAELCVLLSAIGDVPIRQALAITGSINQHGAIQPVGAVNEKIEGYFDACLELGLTGEQGVLIPEANIQHLMLRADVVAAVSDGRFHVHAVRTIDEAIALLAGRPAEAVHAMVEARLKCFSDETRRFMGAGPSHDRWQRHAV